MIFGVVYQIHFKHRSGFFSHSCDRLLAATIVGHFSYPVLICFSTSNVKRQHSQDRRPNWRKKKIWNIPCTLYHFCFFRLLRVVCLGTWEDQYYLEDHFLVSTYLVVESGLELCLLGWMARIFISLFIATSAGGYVCNWHRWIPMDIWQFTLFYSVLLYWICNVM